MGLPDHAHLNSMTVVDFFERCPFNRDKKEVIHGLSGHVRERIWSRENLSAKTLTKQDPLCALGTRRMTAWLG